MKATVLGSGGWGTALSLLLLDNGSDVTLWSFSAQEAEALRAQVSRFVVKEEGER